MIEYQNRLAYPGGWCNGSTRGSGPRNLGSNPGPPAKFFIGLNSMKKILTLIVVLAILSGCATNMGVKETPAQYDPKTGTYHKTYSTGELGSNFVKDLLGVK